MKENTYPALVQLQDEVLACREQAQTKPGTECHKVALWRSHGGHAPQLVVPPVCDLTGPVDVVTVGINPQWSLPLDAPQEDVVPGKDKGDRFTTYKNQILADVKQLLPDESQIAHMELVQCGTKSGRDVWDVTKPCRERFFDRAVEILKPKVLVPIGRFASEHLYWYTTAPGKSGIEWGSMRARHATSERAVVAGHECIIVFTTQPAAGVSREDRQKAAQAIAAAYMREMS